VNEDPLISGGVVKAALVVLVAGALGVGAYAIAGDSIDIDLPDLPDIETTGDDVVVDLGETELLDTTINGAEPPPPGSPADPFTSASFGEALGQAKAEVGAGARLTRLFINDVQTQFILLSGDSAEAISVRADTGELSRDDATITVSGNATLDDFAFPLDGVKASSVDRMLAQARKQSGAGDFRPTVLSLERRIPFGERALEWTINAQGNSRNLLYRADPDGSKVRNEGGAGTEIPPAAIEAQKLNDCIQAAQNNPDEIFACLDRFQ
jgi:hypothetical protein